MSSTTTMRRRPGWWYPYIFVGAFAVVMTVNGAFMYFAIRTFTGLSSDHAYDDGLAYNRVIAEARTQATLGWTVGLEVRPVGGHAADILLTFADKDGNPITGLTGDGLFLRPTSAGHDSDLKMVEQGQGRYLIRAALPLGGQWDMSLKARRGDTDYQLARRIFLP